MTEPAPTPRPRVGPYEVHEALAQGGMGIVYRAVDTRLGRDVVVKLLRVQSERGRKRLHREARAMARFVHANVVPLLDVGEHEGHPYLVLPLLEGKSLEHRLLQSGSLPLDEALKIAGHVGEALYGAHELGLIHRDVKPANVLLDPRGNALLTDFGLVKDVGPSREHTVSLSVYGGALGTPGFWPPEQALGRIEQVGPAADVYALGALLYAMLIGRPPRDHEVQTAMAWDAPLPSMLAERPELPAGLESLVFACLEAQVEDRPSLADVLQSLEQLRAGVALRGQPPGWLLPALGALAVGACVLAVSVWAFRDPPLPQQAAADPAPKSPAEEPAKEPPPAPTKPAPPVDEPQQPPEPVEPAPTATRTELQLKTVSERRKLLALEAGQVGQNHLATGSFRQAVAAFDESLRIDPGSLGGYLGRGMAYAELQEFDRAEEDLAKVLQFDPADLPPEVRFVRYDTLFLRGRIRQSRGRFEGALADFEAALVEKPRSAEAHYRRGLVLSELQRFAAAVEAFGEAIKLAPGAVSSYIGRAQAFEGLGDYPRAIDDYSHATRSGELTAKGLEKHRRARVAAFERYPDAAQRVADAKALLQTAGASVEAARHDDALRDYSAAIERAPLFVEAYAGRAATHVQLGRLPEALADFDWVLDLDPARASAFLSRAKLRRELNRPSEAIADAELALELDEGLSEAHLVRGQALLDSHQDRKALEAFDRALELDPSSAWAHVNRGACHENLQRYPAALADYDRALELGLADDVAPKVRAARAHVARKLAE